MKVIDIIKKKADNESNQGTHSISSRIAISVKLEYVNEGFNILEVCLLVTRQSHFKDKYSR